MDVMADDEILILGVNDTGTKTDPLIKVPVENRYGEHERREIGVFVVQKDEVA